MTDTFDLRLYDLAFASAETPMEDDAVVDWPDEFFQVWLIRPN
jgi:hypothetical protein